MVWCILFTGLVLGLSACTVAPIQPEAPIAPPPSTVTQTPADTPFSLSARFALKIESGERTGSYGGHLDWQHTATSDDLLLSGPLGQGMAEIHVDPQGARVRASNGQQRSAADAPSLIRDTLGYALPLGDISRWLRGRPSSDSRLSTDQLGRPRQLLEAGWRISYEYDDNSPQARPTRITMLREQEMELRLRIEEWQDTP